MRFIVGSFYADRIFIPIDSWMCDVHNDNMENSFIHYLLLIAWVMFYAISYFILYLCDMKID